MKHGRIPSLLATLVASALLLSACFRAPTPTPSPTPTPTEAPVPVPVRVGTVAILVPEFRFYYSAMLSDWYVDASTAAGAAFLEEACTFEGYDGKTWKQYFQQQTAERIRDLVIQSENAKAEGLSLTAAEIASVRDIIDTFVSEQGSEAAALDYLHTYFAKGLDLAGLEALLLRENLAQKFETLKKASFEVTEADIDAYYAATPDSFDGATYRSLFVPVEAASGATDAEKEAARLAARDKAYDILSHARNEETFKALYDANTPSPPEGDDPSLVSGELRIDAEQLLGYEAGVWLFDPERAAGDKFVAGRVSAFDDQPDGYYVLYFLERRRPDDPLMTVRHILRQIDRTDAATTQAAIDEARAAAEAILAQVTDEASFIELARTWSEDLTSAPEGGLVAGFAKGEMVPEFEAWSFDPSRKPGDTGLVQSDYGFHVMWFVASTPKYRFDVETTLRRNRLADYMEAQRTLAAFALVTDPVAMDLD